MSSKRRQVSSGHLDEVLRASLEFILEKQAADGSWSDFLTPAGYSDEWVTGYTGTVLAGIQSVEAQQAAMRAWNFLASRARQSGGWGYNQLVPPDADSTAWSLQLGNTLGYSSHKAVHSGERFLQKQESGTGGFATYPDDGPIRSFLNLPPSITFDGWLQNHVSVSAAVGKLPSFEADVARYLDAAQSPDGRWPSYWWMDDDYSTTLSLEILISSRNSNYESSITKASEWIERRLESVCRSDHAGLDESAYRISWLLRGIIQCPATEKRQHLIEKSLSRLLELVNDDGSWKAGAILRIPRPDQRNPDHIKSWKTWTGLTSPIRDLDDMMSRTFNIVTRDINSVFTTASVLTTLMLCRQNSVGEHD